MIKKEIQETIKVRQKNAEENKKDLKTLDTLNTINENDQNIKGFTQERIKKNVNLYTSEKSFNLFLEDGPYYSEYTKNGSNMLVFNRKGFLSSFNVQNLNLNYETNVNDEIFCAKYLHNEQYVAVAQSKSLFIYNRSGSELHSVRDIKSPRLMEFLPCYFLLASTSSNSQLKYLDTSTGIIVSTLSTEEESPTVLKSNHTNGVVYMGNKNGSVSLWSPAQEKFLMKINCHKRSVTNIEIDRSGDRMITTGLDNTLKVFDIRNTFRPMSSVNTKYPISFTAMSQKNMLAMAHGSNVVVLKDFEEDPYLKHKVGFGISSLSFCNHEDILTIGHQKGISSIIVPGCGDPIFDCDEITPFMTKQQRQDLEVKKLLDKIPFDLISQESIIGGLTKQPVKTMPKIAKRYFSKDTEKTALSRFNK